MKYSFITRHKKTWPINLMCRVLGVLSHGYYSYQKRKRNRPENPRHKKMLSLVKEVSDASKQTYGTRRMSKALTIHGFPASRYKARKLMKEAKIQVRFKRRYKTTTNSKHNHPVFENLLKRDFAVGQPDQAYVSDITYIQTQEGWLYLAVVIDLYSRKVVGWSMDSRMKAQLVCDALQMAIWQRRPIAGLIHHSDRGSQYASHDFRDLLDKNKCKGSMSRKGNCWDNAVAESFFGRLKEERVHHRHYQTRYEAQQDILSYITMFYNSNRLHSYLDYKSPNQFEVEMREMKKVA
jgi:transposase InsO family protein